MTDSRESTETRWTPEQYGKFTDHRLRPAMELLARVPLDDARTVVDLGCGTGQITRRMAERFDRARILGLDHSPQMIEAARDSASAVEWLEGDAGTWEPDSPVDLIYSNAALHWIDGHNELLPRLISFLRPGGCLAVQMPLSREQASHRLMVEVLREGRSNGQPYGTEELTESMARRWVLTPAEYHGILAPHCDDIDLWTTEYQQVLEGEDAVLEWVRGSGLRPVLNTLEAKALEEYIQVYGGRLREAYPADAKGRTLFPFGRLFFVARR